MKQIFVKETRLGSDDSTSVEWFSFSTISELQSWDKSSHLKLTEFNETEFVKIKYDRSKQVYRGDEVESITLDEMGSMPIYMVAEVLEYIKNKPKK